MMDRISLQDGKKTKLNFGNAAGRFRIETVGGSEFEFRFAPNCSVTITPSDDIKDLSLFFDEEDVPSPGKLTIVK